MHGIDWNPSGGILHIVPNELNQVIAGYTPLASRLRVVALPIIHLLLSFSDLKLSFSYFTSKF